MGIFSTWKPDADKCRITNAFICVGCITPPPLFPVKINCIYTNLYIKKKKEHRGRKASVEYRSTGLHSFCGFKMLPFEFLTFHFPWEWVSRRCEKTAITGLRSRASGLTMSSIYAVWRGNESERRDSKHLRSCARTEQCRVMHFMSHKVQNCLTGCRLPELQLHEGGGVRGHRWPQKTDSNISEYLCCTLTFSLGLSSIQGLSQKRLRIPKNLTSSISTPALLMAKHFQFSFVKIIFRTAVSIFEMRFLLSSSIIHDDFTLFLKRLF